GTSRERAARRPPEIDARVGALLARNQARDQGDEQRGTDARRERVHCRMVPVCRVLDAQERPLLDGEVSLGRAAGSQSDRVSLGRDRRGAPTTPGAFEFRCLRPGKYPLWIGAEVKGPPDAEVEIGPRATPSHAAQVVLRQRANALRK